MRAIINYFKTAPMSKKLTVIVTAVWLISISAGHILLALMGVDLSPMVELQFEA